MRFHLTLIAGLLICLASVRVRADGPGPVPPKQNVVLILADDLGAHDVGCCGSTFYETPHLDRLASQGMRFAQAYAACPVCSPTRSALMTGKYPPRTGITNFIGGDRAGRLLPAPYAMQLSLDEVTIAEALKEAGYVTGMAGKWHLGGQGFGPERQGFDEVANGDLKTWNEQVDRADKVTEFALRFLDAHKDRPFFLYLPHNLVHIPLKTKADLLAKYRKKFESLPARDEVSRFRPEGDFEDRRVQDHAAYAAMIEDLDTNVGRVLDRLDELGIADRTLVIFTSDNGGLSTNEGSPTSNAPLRTGKGWLYEGGIRVPLIVRWPGVVRPDSTCAAPVITTDLSPTLLAAAGVPARPAQHRDGISLVPAFKGESLAPRPLFWHYPHYSNQGGGPGGAVRDGDWKLIEWYDGDRAELFHLSDDPVEQTDLAAREPARVRALRGQLAAWRQDVGAQMPTPNPAASETHATAR